jgi:hypothetical protein
MRNMTFSFVHGCALSLTLLGVVGCAVDGSDRSAGEDESQADGSQAVAAEPLDSERAAAITASKMALVDVDAISPLNAACGTAGPNLCNHRVNDAAISGAARQRTGSSTSCTTVGDLQPGNDAIYFCFTFGNDGFTWTYAQNVQSGRRGWTRDDLLRENGAACFCGF